MEYIYSFYLLILCFYVHFVFDEKDDRLLENILEEYKKVKNSINNEDIQTWAVQMLKGLDFLHKNSIIHRAIKPT